MCFLYVQLVCLHRYLQIRQEMLCVTWEEAIFVLVPVVRGMRCIIAGRQILFCLRRRFPLCRKILKKNALPELLLCLQMYMG